MQGYIKLHRQVLEWEWYKNAAVKDLFLHCLLKANHADKKWQGVLIKKGSFITSYENLSIETGLSYKQIRTALDKLKKTGEVAHQSTSRYSVITIKNWDRFQIEGSQEGSQRAVKGQAEGRQRATTNNDNNDNNVKNDNIENPAKKIDYNSDPIIYEVFKIYKETCTGLVKLDKFCNRNVELKKLVGLYLEQTGSDLGYFKRVCEIANKIKRIGSVNVDLKMILKNHDGFYNGKYSQDDVSIDTSSVDWIRELEKKYGEG